METPINGTALLPRFTQSARRFGFVKAIYDFAVRSLNRLVYFRILKGLSIDKPDPKMLDRRPEYSYGFLGRAVLLAFAVDPEYEMNERFLRDAFSKGHRCYGVMHGNTLASYGWYSTEPTAALDDRLEVRFDPNYVYMYKGFTHKDYRGERLHAAGMAQALDAYLGEGRKGLVSYVESNNFSSLRSCERMGYESFGDVVVVRAWGRYFITETAGCRERGFQFAPKERQS